MLAAARQIESNAGEIHQLITAAEAYERVEQLHPWTLAAGTGAAEAQRMRSAISQEVSTEKDALYRSREEARAQRKSLRNQVESALQEVEQHLLDGSPLKARAIADRLETIDLSSLPASLTDSIRFPVLVESIPSGARILDGDRNLLGTSPVTLTLSKDEQVELILEKRGCRTRKLEVSGQSVPHLLVSLVRSPDRTLKLSEPAERMTILGELVVTSGRDGKIRLLNRDLLRPVEDHSVGIEGHPAPALLVGLGEVLALPLAGKPLLISDTGETATLGPVNSAPWTQAVFHPHQGWILGDADGMVHFLDDSGQLGVRQQLTAPIVSLSVDDSGQVIAVDAMRYCQHFESDGSIASDRFRIPGDHFSMLSDGTRLFASGIIWSAEHQTPAPPPHSAPRASGDLNFYNSASGWVIWSGHEAHETRFDVPSTCSPLGHSSRTDQLWVAGADGILRLFSLKGEVMGEVALGAEATDMNVTKPGEILVSLADGTLCVVKEQE